MGLRRGGGLLAAALLMGGTVVVQGSASRVAGQQAAPIIAVEPSGGLSDGQTVEVSGEGFDPSETQVGLYECAPSPAPSRCRTVWPDGAPIDSEGSFRQEAPVRVIVPDGLGGTVDCRTSPEPCLLIASLDLLQSPGEARAELRFATDGPLLPEPELSVEPDAGLRDFSRLAVRGSGFTPGGRVHLRICRRHEAGRRCDAESGERPTADADGRIEADLGGWARFEPPGPGGPSDAAVVCRQAPGCAVTAFDEERGLGAETTLGFGPPDSPRGRYLDPVFDDVQVDQDVVYRETLDHHGNPVELSMYIYRPAGDTASRRPAIVWMHGGWFVFGSPATMHSYAMESARRGYVAVSLEYRLRPDMSISDFPQLYEAMVDAHEDALAGVEWLRAHAEEWGIDPDVIAAGGWSAGAVTATNLAYFPGQRGPAGSPVVAALPIAGWFVRPDQPLPIEGPFAVPDAGEPPSIVFHGSMDQLLPWGSPRDLCPLADEAGIVCEYVGYDGDGHEIQIGRRRDVVRRSFDFLAEQVLEPHGYLDVEVDAGGRYAVDEGSTVAVEGSGSADDPAGELAFAWWPADRFDDPSAPATTFRGWDDGEETITLTATSSRGISAADDAVVATRNVDPAIADVRTDRRGRRVAVDVTLTDPGSADTHAVEVDWGDGTIDRLTVDQGEGRATAHGSHRYARRAPVHRCHVRGGRRLTITVTDDDGGSDRWTSCRRR